MGLLSAKTEFAVSGKQRTAMFYLGLVMPDVFFNGGVMHVSGDFKPGDQPPTGYLDWHEWADIQHKAGLKQKQCGRCEKWCFPQQLSEICDRTPMKSSYGKVILETPVCNKCAK